jgi:hypothetical protein
MQPKISALVCWYLRQIVELGMADLIETVLEMAFIHR